MLHRKSKRWVGWVAVGGIAIGLSHGSAPAHTVKTSGNVAATFHLEPHHNPQAGEPAQVWFALTKAGGEIVPLQNCDCQLVVRQSGQVLQQLPLKAINAEQYQGIPGSDVVFPAVGIYTLELSGKAKNGHDFQPFQFNYEVTVQPGRSQTTPTVPTQNAPIGAVIDLGRWVIAGLMGGAIVGGIVWWRRG